MSKRTTRAEWEQLFNGVIAERNSLGRHIEVLTAERDGALKKLAVVDAEREAAKRAGLSAESLALELKERRLERDASSKACDSAIGQRDRAYEELERANKLLHRAAQLLRGDPNVKLSRALERHLKG